MTFRDRLLGTLRLLQPILEVPGVLVVGSEVPNLPQPTAASTLVVSQDAETYVLDDAELPLMVFGPIGLLRPGPVIEVDGLFVTMDGTAFDEVIRVVGGLSAESRHTVRSSLTVRSLIEARPGMPDPLQARAQVTQLLARIEASSPND